MSNLSDDPVLWQKSPAEIANSVLPLEITDNSIHTAVAGAIQQERDAVRPYVRSCTDVQWATEPGAQERIHKVILNGTDVTAVCVGFNTVEGWVELLVSAGSDANGFPRLVLNRHPDPLRRVPLTVRVMGDVHVVMMTGTFKQVVPNGFAGHVIR